MYIVYIDDTIAGTFNSPVAAELYAKQLLERGHESVHVDYDK